MACAMRARYGCFSCMLLRWVQRLAARHHLYDQAHGRRGCSFNPYAGEEATHVLSFLSVRNCSSSTTRFGIQKVVQEIPIPYQWINGRRSMDACHCARGTFQKLSREVAGVIWRSTFHRPNIIDSMFLTPFSNCYLAFTGPPIFQLQQHLRSCLQGHRQQLLRQAQPVIW